eukprot:15449308-Alexandrium_andersonii.AAC.1
MAWVRDPGFKDTFFQMTEHISAVTSVAKLLQWCSKKEMRDAHGDEFEQMVEDSTFFIRRNPENN